jgi:hypothetical protein
MKTSTQLRVELHDVRVDLCSYDGKVTVTADNGDAVEIKGATPEQLLKAADRLIGNIRWSAKDRDADLWIDRLSDLQAEVERTMGALRDKIEKKAKEAVAA